MTQLMVYNRTTDTAWRYHGDEETLAMALTHYSNNYPDRNPAFIYFFEETPPSQAELDAEEKIRIQKVVAETVDACYGTDPRHQLVGLAVANKLVDDEPIPWKLSQHFGRMRWS